MDDNIPVHAKPIVKDITKMQMPHTESTGACIDDLMSTIIIYIIAQDIVTFWLVLAYDLLEDRRTIDVITTKFFTLCFKMAENFVQKSLVEALNRYKKQGEER